MRGESGRVLQALSSCQSDVGAALLLAVLSCASGACSYEPPSPYGVSADSVAAADHSRLTGDVAATWTSIDSKVACGTSLPAQLGLCGNLDFREGDSFKVARVDVNADAKFDLVVRTFSRSSCGSQGCSTSVYLLDGDHFRLSRPNIISIGAVRSCRSKGKYGLRFDSGDGPGRCFVFD